jgi:hypothetical protein
MGYEILILLVPLLVYAVCQDLRDAHKIQRGKRSLVCEILEDKPRFGSGSGRYLLIVGFCINCLAHGLITVGGDFSVRVITTPAVSTK